MDAPSKLLTGAHRERGVMIWAAVDPSASEVPGVLGQCAFTAKLAPFRTHEDAEVELAMRGCIV